MIRPVPAFDSSTSAKPKRDESMEPHVREDGLIGQRIDGRYEVHSQEAESEWGTVYLVRDLKTGRWAALKMHRTRRGEGSAEAEKRFDDEACVLAWFCHPNIPQILDVGVTGSGRPYYVMEFVDGQTFGDLIKQGGPMDWRDASALIRQVLLALIAVHGRGFVHRDIKPANLMVSSKHNGATVKVVDFGLALAIDADFEAQHKTAPGVVVGTRLYMAPEQAAGETVDGRCDQYAIAAVFYELLVGQPARRLEGGSEMPSMQVQPMPLGQRVPRAIETLIMRALSETPGQRFPRLEGMLEELDVAVKGGSSLEFYPRRGCASTPSGRMQCADIGLPGRMDRGLAGRLLSSRSFVPAALACLLLAWPGIGRRTTSLEELRAPELAMVCEASMAAPLTSDPAHPPDVLPPGDPSPAAAPPSPRPAYRPRSVARLAPNPRVLFHQALAACRCEDGRTLLGKLRKQDVADIQTLSEEFQVRCLVDLFECVPTLQ